LHEISDWLEFGKIGTGLVCDLANCVNRVVFLPVSRGIIPESMGSASVECWKM